MLKAKEPRPAPPVVEHTFTGTVRTHRIGGGKREYVTLEVTFREVQQFFKVQPYRHAERESGKSAEGEQREAHWPHVLRLKKAFENNEYVPSTLHAGLRAYHRDAVCRSGDQFSLTVSSARPLPLLNGGHRSEALKQLHKEWAAAGRDDADELLGVPFSITLLLDGTPAQDFLRLQLGRQVDKSHTLSVSVDAGVVDETTAAALRVAQALKSQDRGFLHRFVRLDSQGGGSTIPVSALCAKGSSDLATSLLGLVKLGTKAGDPPDVDFLASCVKQTHEAIKDFDEDLLASGRVLATPPAHTKGGVTLLIGISALVAKRLRDEGATNISNRLRKHLGECVSRGFGEDFGGDLSGPTKRYVMREFADDFFGDIEVEKHGGVPLSVLDIIPASAFALKAPKKPRVPLVRKPAYSAGVKRVEGSNPESKPPGNAEVGEAQ